MPFQIIRADIAQIQADAIVNTANPRPLIGVGVDSRLHEAAGPELLAARKRIGDIAPGDAAMTDAFGLKARYVIHTVGPVWRGGLMGERRLLRSCYDRSLQLALEGGCKSVAFPLIASGHYGFPKDKALKTAIEAFSDFLMNHEMDILLVVFDHSAYRLSEKLFHSVKSYIDEHYVNQYGMRRPFRSCAPMAARACEESAALPEQSLEDILRQTDAGFTETLLNRIDQTGKKDSVIYKRANLSKQHFSKIRNNPGYQPTKPTAIALALALELDLEGTQDLIGRAGFALTNSSKFDLIIRYFIERKNYNVVEINLALYEFDQPLLGA